MLYPFTRKCNARRSVLFENATPGFGAHRLIEARIGQLLGRRRALVSLFLGQLVRYHRHRPCLPCQRQGG
jgi:hypothetical protein